jgi:hypothetical protein
MSDSAKGPIVGFIFQFERALLMLAELVTSTDYISIEEVDDIAKHKEDGTILVSIQAKHSISNSGSTFGDTSYALWRTLELWTLKLEQNIFDENTKFTCTTNKEIWNDSLLYRLKHVDADSNVAEINELLKAQNEKLKTAEKGTTIKETIKLVKSVLSRETQLRLILKNLDIEKIDSTKDRFLAKLNWTSDQVTNTQRDLIYTSFFGWIFESSSAKWKNSEDARFTKQDFDNKWFNINTNHSIKNAIFRTKELIGAIPDEEQKIAAKKGDLFVKQIEDIERNQASKEQIIKRAIQDFLYHEIEVYYIIGQGNFTNMDFTKFLNECYDEWQRCYEQFVLKEISEYTDEEKNSIAINIYDTVMNKVEIKFQDNFSFNQGNKYIKNGSFLKLSDEPTIGWHPEWKSKYSK